MNFLPKEVSISSETDIVVVRKCVREAATQLGFGVTDVTRIITAVSELARNAFLYAGRGVLRCRTLDQAGKVGIELIVEDNGPGITNIEQAMEAGYTTGGGLGLGLPGTKRLMDEMEIQSEAGKGTKITVKKWHKKVN
jgi:serine/threonine-protein kinase RsbT